MTCIMENKGILLSETKRRKDTKLWTRWLTDSNMKLNPLFRVGLNNKYNTKVKVGKSIFQKQNSLYSLEMNAWQKKKGDNLWKQT